jgi:hypothetical protein
MKIAFSGAAALLLIDVMSASAGNLAGQYQVTGKNVDGSTYSGTAQIVVTSDTTCRISWQTDASASKAPACGTAQASRRAIRSPTRSGSCTTRSSPTERWKDCG